MVDRTSNPNLQQRAMSFLTTMVNAGPQCECEPYGHTCGWPTLYELVKDMLDAGWNLPTPVETTGRCIDCIELKNALAAAVKVANEARECHDRDQDMRTMKLLIALCGHLPKWRADTDRIHDVLRRAVERLSAPMPPEEPTVPRESDWHCVHCGRENDPSATHCVQCEWSRKHTIAGVLHERGCFDHPCICGAVNGKG